MDVICVDGCDMCRWMRLCAREQIKFYKSENSADTCAGVNWDHLLKDTLKKRLKTSLPLLSDVIYFKIKSNNQCYIFSFKNSTLGL
jgi:hypothetical protein